MYSIVYDKIFWNSHMENVVVALHTNATCVYFAHLDKSG